MRGVVITADTVMDNRFDRRELLFHLGDVLEALCCLGQLGRQDAPVAQLAKQNESLQEFEFLHALTPNMTVGEFGARVASALFLWPKELLEPELNRNALASTVQHDLLMATLTAGRNTSSTSRRR
jgi:hypothetical protein